MSTGVYLWFCCGCGDGPKTWSLQPACPLCWHRACRNCLSVKLGSSTTSFSSPSANTRETNRGQAAEHDVPRPLIHHVEQSPVTPSRVDRHPRAPAVSLAHARKGRGASLFHRSEPSSTLGSLWTEEDSRNVTLTNSPLSLAPDFGRNGIANSTSDPSTEDEAMDFALMWKKHVIPVLLRRVPSILDDSFTTDVVRDPKQFANDSQNASTKAIVYRLVLFTSPSVLNEYRRGVLKELVSVCLPEQYVSFTRCEFVVGDVRRCCDLYCGTSENDPDISCVPKRMFYQPKPAMGASIGLYRSNCTGTLGGYVLINGEHYMGLSCDHIFEGVDETGKSQASYEGIGESVMQPSYDDSRAESEHFGQLVYSSGYRKRPPVIPTMKIEKDQDYVRVDWALLSVEERRLGRNVMVMDDYDRYAMDVGDDPSDQSVRTISRQASGCGGIGKLIPGQPVHSVGRTSGYQKSRVVEAESVYFDKKTKTTTLEWGLYLDYQSHSQWIVKGPGQPGDSGAWVIDRNNNTYLGMIFARGPTWGVGRRIAYFSTFENIEADIKDVFKENNIQLSSVEFIKPEIILALPNETEAEISGVGEKLHSDDTPSPVAITTSTRTPFDQIAEDVTGVGWGDPIRTMSEYQSQPSFEDELSNELESLENQQEPQDARLSGQVESVIKQDAESRPVIVRRVGAVGGIFKPWQRHHLQAFKLVLPVM